MEPEMELLTAALLLGLVSGLRTFTALGALWLIRHTGPVAFGLGVTALLEYVADLYPRAPSRTSASGLGARLLAGGFCGWAAAAPAGNAGIIGALLGACGAVIGAYVGLAMRLRAIALVGPIPAALLEDAIAIVGAVVIVSYAM